MFSIESTFEVNRIMQFISTIYVILVYKLINEQTIIDVHDSFHFIHRHRSHNKHLYMNYSRTDKRKYFWINRIVNIWNNLSYETVNSTSTNVFRNNVNSVKFQGRGSIYCY